MTSHLPSILQCIIIALPGNKVHISSLLFLNLLSHPICNFMSLNKAFFRSSESLRYAFQRYCYLDTMVQVLWARNLVLHSLCGNIRTLCIGTVQECPSYSTNPSQYFSHDPKLKQITIIKNEFRAVLKNRWRRWQMWLLGALRFGRL